MDTGSMDGFGNIHAGFQEEGYFGTEQSVPSASSAEADGTHFIQNHHDFSITLGPPSSEQPQGDLDNAPNSFVDSQPANMHTSEIDADSEEDDELDSTTLADSPESTGGATVYGGTAEPSPMVNDTHQGIDKWTLPSRESKNVLCVLCGKILYEIKGFRRHFDDLHADPEKCPECDLWVIGKRKLKTHLKRVHKIEVSP